MNSLSERAATHRSTNGRAIPWARSLALALLALVLFVGSAFGAIYYNLVSSIQTHDLDSLVSSANRPVAENADKKNRALNILILGSDSREGYTTHTDVTGMRADTTMLMHISKDRKRVDVVSIPRDMLVPIPSCNLPDGSKSTAKELAMFNSAFAVGGTTGDVGAAAACAVSTVEQMTGIYIDDYAVVNFNGFQDIVNSLGGVDICVAEPIDDKAAHLKLPAGCQTLGGEDALALARARKSIGDGSDIGRIDRQQQVVTSIINKALKQNSVSDLPTLYRTVQSVIKNLDVSKGLGDISFLASLASNLTGLKSDSLNFYTMPWDWAGARVVPSPTAPQVWEALKADQPVPPDALTKAAKNNAISSANGGLGEVAGSGFAILKEKK
ncbi:LCP family protein required for cell wall assembly [Arcanobacterium wilhelmae]|uniref:LCP family protein required for cell wall assembly n=1 Tax=Arcanobacterium wilhelmae TaxID=1803177 RepID=A0ABT9NC91_9ACTO|nr:LCP family protein [Arcanobacterium wilhelmae]MDP9801344.1 LCP family protein required for cell wall assembly [Arcanobacterium wilhelmae]WFN90682.1 LCP family protein [Arcanobacterium wilhelmae]